MNQEIHVNPEIIYKENVFPMNVQVAQKQLSIVNQMKFVGLVQRQVLL